VRERGGQLFDQNKGEKMRVKSFKMCLHTGADRDTTGGQRVNSPKGIFMGDPGNEGMVK